MERAELLGAKVLWEDDRGEFRNIVDSKGFSGVRPGDDLLVIRVGFYTLGFAIEHLVEPARELLRYPSLSRTGEGELSQGACNFDHSVQV